jgi:hypothetical protein
MAASTAGTHVESLHERRHSTGISTAASPHIARKSSGGEWI